MDKVQIAIIGAGVAGMAIAQKLSETFKDILVLDKHSSYGQETSSRNSEVIHAGIYYPPGSLKHLLCIQGNSMLYLFCEENNISYKQIGKLIVANDEAEEELLSSLYRNAIQNGVNDVKLLGEKKIAQMEPDIKARKAIYSGNTGIIDSHAYLKALYHKCVEQRVTFSFNTKSKKIITNKEK